MPHPEPVDVTEEITIGDLAARTRLSRKAVRLCGDRGLLVPARVDPRTGKRYYAPDQVERARRIALLRTLGMPLADIAAVLALDGPEAAARVAAYRNGVESAHAARRPLPRTYATSWKGTTSPPTRSRNATSRSRR